MVTVQLNGGLGNQLFQYAAAKSLALEHGVPLLMDVSAFRRESLPELEVPRDFELYNFAGVEDKTVCLSEAENEAVVSFLKKKSLAKLLPNHKRKIYSEPFYHFDPCFFKARKDALLRGQWQSEKYFLRRAGFFRKALRLKPVLAHRVQAQAAALSAAPSVAVHVRRADYLRKKIILEWHGVMGRDYYAEAFAILDARLGDYSVHYFTDDTDWVKAELFPLREGELVSEQTRSHHEDFYLLSHCRHQVIANSSFSWWAAWLNANPQKIVIGPRCWFGPAGPKDTQDVLPASWLRI